MSTEAKDEYYNGDDDTKTAIKKKVDNSSIILTPITQYFNPTTYNQKGYNEYICKGRIKNKMSLSEFRWEMIYM